MEYVITRTAPDGLVHSGIKGQKWGVRRFENEDGTLTEEGKKRYNKNAQNPDYTQQQRLYDRTVYSKGAEKRINRRMNEGYGLKAARSLEAQRIDKARSRADTAGKVAGVAGVIVGLLAPNIIKAGANAMGYSGVANTLRNAMNNPTTAMLTRIGASAVLPGLMGKAARNVTMRVHGYSPSKYSGSSGSRAIETASGVAGVMGIGG